MTKLTGAEIKQSVLTNGKYLMRLLVEVYRQFWARDCQQSAASLTYVTLFSLVPLLTLLYSMFSLFPPSAGLEAQVQTLIFDNLVPASGQAVENYLADFTARARNLSVPGAILLMVTAFLMLKNIEKAFNKIWGVTNARAGFMSFLNYWAVLTLGPVLIGAGIFMSTYLLSLKVVLADSDYVPPVIFSYLPWLFSASAFTLFFIAVPNLRVPVRDALIGGAVTALLFELVKGLFSDLVARSSYELIYGAFAIVPLFLLWIYILWVLVLAGAVLVRCLSHLRIESKSQGYSDLVAAVLVLTTLCSQMKNGVGLRTSQVVQLGLYPDQWQRIKRRLSEANILVESQGGRYFLARGANDITLRHIAGAVEDVRFFKESESLQTYSSRLSEFFNRLQACDESIETNFDITLANLIAPEQPSNGPGLKSVTS